MGGKTRQKRNESDCIALRVWKVAETTGKHRQGFW